MKPVRLILLSILFLVLCAAHKAVGAEVPTIKEADAITLAKAVPKLKPAQWVAAPGLEFKLAATTQKLNTGITVAPEEVYLIVPHPTDLWAQGPQNKYRNVPWNDGEINLHWFIGQDDTDAAGAAMNIFVKGDGPLMLGHGDANAGDNWGSIRVKLLKVVKAVKARK